MTIMWVSLVSYWISSSSRTFIIIIIHFSLSTFSLKWFQVSHNFHSWWRNEWYYQYVSGVHFSKKLIRFLFFHDYQIDISLFINLLTQKKKMSDKKKKESFNSLKNCQSSSCCLSMSCWYLGEWEFMVVVTSPFPMSLKSKLLFWGMLYGSFFEVKPFNSQWFEISVFLTLI